MITHTVLTCKDCRWYKFGWCKIFKIWISEKAAKCDEYKPKLLMYKENEQ